MLSVRLIKKLEGIEKCTKEVESRVRLTPPARFGGRRTHAPQRCDGAYPTVMGRIGVALSGKITPRESGQTSIRSFPTREPELPTLETKRMAAVETQAGAVPNEQIDWTTIDWRTVNQNVRRLQARIVEATQAEVVKPSSEKSVGKVYIFRYLGQLFHIF